jgi:3-oxoacyl-[acyl-carrier protein] reductase
MAERGFGRVVNITSSAVKAPIATLGLSNGARSGLTGFVAGTSGPWPALASPSTTCCPAASPPTACGPISTTWPSAPARAATAVEAAAKKSIPAGRFGDPAEFGAYCAFLCSAHAGYVTGQNVLIDGGAYPGTF